ncbi:MAG TPA: MFS transporter [Tepidisphaeraceae bacterium]|jgi:MFS family permease
MDSVGAPPDNPALNTDPASGLKFMLRALRHRNYRLFFVGQGVSVIGTWLTTTATSWLVFRLASESGAIHAATVLGIVRFAALAPVSVLAPIAGVLIDRWNRHHVLVVTQFLSMIQSGALAMLTYSGKINVGQIIGLSVFQGLINVFDAPARQAFVVEIVEHRADLANAIALNSSMFNGARLIGPAIAGFLIAAVGEAMCFSIDAVSYLAVLIALLMMRLPRVHSHPREHSAWRELRDGFRYSIGFAPVRAMLILAGLISFTVGAFQTLMPIFADEAAPAGRGAAVFGFLGAAVGVGSLAGAVYLASRRTVVGLGKVIAVAAGLGGVAMIGFAASHSLLLMMITCVFAGFGMIVTFAGSNTLLQTMVEDEMRGRLMSFFIVAVMGAAPLGSLIAGWVADRIGDARTTELAGAISVAAALLFLVKLPALRVLVRPIYIRKGIIPEVAAGLEPQEQ